MHQHAPALAPHSNGVPQRAQQRRCSGAIESVEATLMLALSGVMAGKINHAGMTVLRQRRVLPGAAFMAFFFHSPGPIAATAISAYDPGGFCRLEKEPVDDRSALLDHAER